ncbi:uncharacterized protein LOC112500981 [Cynara cardunculus var. scolymus]|uniref:uncharacterized protein LOC112500981 n=1 Tax=Cynara cardunculus var. scolymus TaxID=59895 RepID=UPI000D62F634|nr:uncharacterized protein LOC112500981 [Cynara cardunculus var. scolymus]
MLLKSSSNPALNSWFQQQSLIGISSPEPDFIHRNLRSPTISLYSSSSLNELPKKIIRASSESDLIGLSKPKRRNSLNSSNCLISSMVVEEDVEAEDSETRGLLFSSSGLDGDEGCRVQAMVDGSGGGDGGRKICGGGGGNGDYYGSDGTDLYYQNMIESNPANSLILANYAKYLKEIRGDFVKAEEFCSRAILANPSDGNALSMYADLIWETQRDSSRAQSYFDQAVKAAPDDCYVMASYARFLWDADEQEDDEEREAVSEMNVAASPGFFQEASQFPIAAAS